MAERNAHYYLLIVWGDVCPDLEGSFVDELQRDEHARRLKAKYGDEHGMFALEVDPKGQPTVSSYSAMFFEDMTGGRPRV